MQSRTASATAQYLTRIFVKDDPFAAMRAAGDVLHPGMQLSPYEAHLLQWLVRISGARHVLEIGSFAGYSACWMAHALPDSGTLTTLEKQPAHATLARTHTQHDTRIHVVEADAIHWLHRYEGAAFDMLFIDGEKRRYGDYLDAALPHLTAQAWIIADNTLLFGALAGIAERNITPETVAAMQQFNARLADASAFETVLLPTAEGLTVARRRLVDV
jgi:predicted O-methyltransferase YrrM